MPLNGEYAPSSSDWAREQAELYERTGGAEGNDLRGRPVILLATLGAKTGKLRKTPLMRVEHAGQYVVVASQGGAPEHPAWHYNLVANPICELQDLSDRHDYRARMLHEGPERDAWWARACEVWPDYAVYQTKTDRRIPLWLLDPEQRPSSRGAGQDS